MKKWKIVDNTLVWKSENEKVKDCGKYISLKMWKWKSERWWIIHFRRKVFFCANILWPLNLARAISRLWRVLINCPSPRWIKITSQPDLKIWEVFKVLCLFCKWSIQYLYTSIWLANPLCQMYTSLRKDILGGRGGKAYSGKALRAIRITLQCWNHS